LFVHPLDHSLRVWNSRTPDSLSLLPIVLRAPLCISFPFLDYVSMLWKKDSRPKPEHLNQVSLARHLCIPPEPLSGALLSRKERAESGESMESVINEPFDHAQGLRHGTVNTNLEGWGRKKRKKLLHSVPLGKFFRSDTQISCNSFNQTRRIVSRSSMLYVHGERLALTRKPDPFVVSIFKRAIHGKSLQKLLKFPSVEFREFLHTATSITCTWLSGMRS
jgi:hypothetical protein